MEPLTKDAASWVLGMVPVPSVAKRPMACRLWMPLVMASRSAYVLKTDGASSGATDGVGLGDDTAEAHGEGGGGCEEGCGQRTHCVPFEW